MPQASSSSPQTVYTVRFTTSFERGAALLEPLCGVNLCLIGKDGRGYLHRVAPVNDPQENVQRMETICQVMQSAASPAAPMLATTTSSSRH
jgi:hypothetical protein